MKTQLTIAKTLLWVATTSALAAGVSAISAIHTADDTAKMLQLWVCIGYFTFAILFGMLAWRPHGNGNLWTIAFINKLALTLSAIFFISDKAVTGVKDIIIWDGMLVVLLAVAFFLSRKSNEPEEPALEK